MRIFAIETNLQGYNILNIIRLSWKKYYYYQNGPNVLALGKCYSKTPQYYYLLPQQAQLRIISDRLKYNTIYNWGIPSKKLWWHHFGSYLWYSIIKT